VIVAVASGKGGTGKTTVAVSLALSAPGKVRLLDCDVEELDCYLFLRCGYVTSSSVGLPVPVVDAAACTACGVCGELYLSETRVGPMVHACLEPGGESSGKLVSLVRQEARRIAAERGEDLILVDGPAGIGCPVIASLAGATTMLAVAEPTVSGAHDLARLLELAAHFRVPAAVCVNKWDLSPALTGKVEDVARDSGTPVLGRIPYDLSVTAAQVAGRTAVEQEGVTADRIVALWERLQRVGGNGATRN